jgi:hypothetical protein
VNTATVSHVAGSAPLPTCKLHVVDRVCTLNICKLKLNPVRVLPVVLNVNAKAAPGSPKAPVCRIAGARFVLADWAAAFDVDVNPVAAAEFRNDPADVVQSTAAVPNVATPPTAIAVAPVRTDHPCGNPVAIPLKFCV